MYSLGFAYLLWFLSGFGAMGFHRFYLNKIGTGIIWFLTGGLGMLGSIYDFFTLPIQVKEANLRERYRETLLYEEGFPPRSVYLGGMQKNRESIERVILKTAKKNNGVVTPTEIALEADIPIEKAKKYLDKLAESGYAEMRVSKNGIIAYVFPELKTDPSRMEFEDF
ncbi:MAG: hypothetical protein DRP87_09900 [Spirochaetes bacterium]|nr:MAG: hypothetical protein DRP87_09900 [Spirochaetota bacterium]